MRADADAWFKFTWVAGCLLVALFRLARAICRRDAVTDAEWLVFGLGMTVAADYAMVICEDAVKGLYCFLAVQLFYFLRLEHSQKTKKTLVISLFLLGAYMWFFGKIEKGLNHGWPAAGLLMWERFLGWEGFLGICYFVLFTGNLFYAWRKRSTMFLFGEGLFLFWLCDLHVGLLNLGRFVKLSEVYWQWIFPYSQKALWLFYLPSQVLISFSACNRMKDRPPEAGGLCTKKEGGQGKCSIFIN